MSLILWAEDEASDRLLITEALGHLPYRPSAEFVSDGAELLRRLEEEKPGLIVLDLGLVGMGGMETLKQLKAGPRKRIPVVVFTGHDDPKEAQACFDLGARDVLQKPTDFNSFRGAVQRIVQHTAH